MGFVSTTGDENNNNMESISTGIVTFWDLSLEISEKVLWCLMNDVGWTTLNEWLQMNDFKWMTSNEWLQMNDFKWMTSNEWHQLNDIKWMTSNEWRQMNDIKWMTSNEWHQMNEVEWIKNVICNLIEFSDIKYYTLP